MLIDTILQFVLEAGGDLFDGARYLRPLAEGRFAIDMGDVVEVDVDRQPRQVEIEKIQRRSALQGELRLEEGMLVEFGQQFPQAKDFLEIVGGESRVARELCDLGGRELHVRTESAPEDENVSGTMSFQAGTQWLPGRLSAR